MRNKIVLGAVGFAVLGVTFFVGFGFGGRYVMGFMMPNQLAEVQGTLNSTVEVLCMLRIGDTAGAISLLEPRVDNVISTMPRDDGWDDLSDGMRRALVLGKVYKTAFPPEDPSPGLVEALDMIPEPSIDHRYRKPAVNAVLRISREKRVD